MILFFIVAGYTLSLNVFYKNYLVVVDGGTLASSLRNSPFLVKRYPFICKVS